LSSPSPHPSTAAPPALTPFSAPPHPRTASQPFPFPAWTPELRLRRPPSAAASCSSWTAHPEPFHATTVP
jgi:hypothetical protein